MLENIFRIRPRRFLGIDIGISYVKIVELSRKGNKIALENYGELGILKQKDRAFRVFTEDTLLLSDRDVAKAIRVICDEARIQAKEVNFSIPDFASFFTTINLPSITKEEIAEAVRYEVRPHVPLPLSEVNLGWVVTEGEPGKSAIKVLAVAVPNDVVRQYEEIALISGLKLKALEPEVFALARSLKPLITNGTSPKLVALIDIGARSTTYNIFEQGVLKTSHSSNIGANELTETLARSLNIDYNKAEELKIKSGIAGPSSGAEASRLGIREIILPLIDAIMDETKKVFRDFYRTKGEDIQRIILAGGTALLPGLKEYFAAELNKEVIIADPFSQISYPKVLGETLKKSSPSYAVAVGLALKGFE